MTVDDFQEYEGSEADPPKVRTKPASALPSHRRPGHHRSDYLFHTLIGEGSLGRVHEATHIATGEHRAVKMVRKAKLAHSPSLRQMVCEEVHILQRPSLQSNPYIVKLYCSFQDEGYLYYCFELIKGGSLSKILERLSAFRSCPVVPLHLIRLWIGELLSVVSTLNKEGIVHRDLKPDNVLLADGHVRVIDFNNATAGGKSMLNPEINKDAEQVDQEFGGTIPWWAPERVALYNTRRGNAPLIMPAGYEPVPPNSGTTAEIEIDLWSIGCIMYEMLTGRNPFLRATAELTADRILRYAQIMTSFHASSAMDGLEFPSSVTPEARDLCLKLLHPSPLVRLEVLAADFEAQHPFLADIHFRQLLSSVEAGDLVDNLLSSAEKQQSGRVGPISASMLEFTPEIGQRFDGRELVGSIGVRNNPFAGVPSAIPEEDGPADIYPSTPVHKAMRMDENTAPPTTSGRRRGNHSSSSNSRRRVKAVAPPQLIDFHPPPASTTGTSGGTATATPSRTTSVSGEGGSSGRSTPDQRACASPKDRAPSTPETTAEDVQTTAANASSWAIEMSSDAFRDFMIPFVVAECKRFVGEDVDDVVGEAGLLTWGPVKVSFTMALPPPERTVARFAVCRQVLQIDTPKPSSPTADTAFDMLPTVLEEPRSVFCCAQSPSVMMFSKLRKWLQFASGFGGLLTDDPVGHTSPPAVLRSPPHTAPPKLLTQLPPPMLPLPPPKSASTRQVPDLICFGVLTSRFGLMLFIADVAKNDCTLRGCLRPTSGSPGEVKRENGHTFRVTAETPPMIWLEDSGTNTSRVTRVDLDVDCDEIAEKWGPHLHTAFSA